MAGIFSHSIFLIDTEDETIVYGVAEYKRLTELGVVVVAVVVVFKMFSPDVILGSSFLKVVPSETSFFLKVWSTNWVSDCIEDDEADSCGSVFFGTR